MTNRLGNVGEMLESLQLNKKLSAMGFGKKKQLEGEQESVKQLHTVWGEKLDPKAVLQEYPRPQLVRNYEALGFVATSAVQSQGEMTAYQHVITHYRGEGYCNLNGYWNYAITKYADRPKQWDGIILVPFSPESYLSGVTPVFEAEGEIKGKKGVICPGRFLAPEDFLWYEKTIWISEPLTDHSRMLLHFGAVDQECVVWVNGVEVGRHNGGYLPFSLEITKLLVLGENRLTVRVQDSTDQSYFSRGKQSTTPGGMFYTPQSGIWQTVWMERVPGNYIREMKITPLLDQKSVRVRVFMDFEKKTEKGSPMTLTVLDEGKAVATLALSGGTNIATIPLPEVKPWTPETPHLYELSVVTPDDAVVSYFAMRLITKEEDENGILRLCLNHKPYFQNGVLDQGYWPESLMTPPADEAMVYDILQMKQSGFNMIRKHCQIAPMRFYYHCDRLGMLVWQDMVNGGGAYDAMHMTYLPTVSESYGKRADGDTQKRYQKMGRGSKPGRQMWLRECMATVHLLYNSPCVVAWVLFNEGWGQFDSLKATEQVRQMDPTRMIDHASGWFDQGGSDMRSEHCYFFPLKVDAATIRKKERVFVLSEYGGHAWRVEGHATADYVYGYHTHKNAAEYQEAFEAIQEKILGLVEKGLSAAVYTQVSDIEEEVNGILTYDRKVNKLLADREGEEA